MGIDKTIKLLCHVSHINTDVHYINLWTTVNIIIPPIKPYFPISILSALKLPYVIYKSSLKQGSKNGVFSPIFYPKLVSKPLYVVVNLYYFSSEPQYVIRIILSTCLEVTIKMSLEYITPLVEGYISEILMLHLHLYLCNLLHSEFKKVLSS
jgi:hypothetical protein